MKTTYLLLPNLILALAFRTAQAGDNGSAVREGRLSLDELTNVVLANNPAIKAAQEKWQAMKARVPQAAAWEDLRAQARSRVARYVSIPPNAFTDQSFVLQQEVPISGKNLSRARAATAEAGTAFEDFRRTELDILSRARAAFHRLANEYAQLEVKQRNVDLLNKFAEVNRQHYEAGQVVSELDVGVSIGLPFLNQRKYSATVTEARRNFESTQHELEATRTETLGLVRDQLKKIETAAHHYELYRDKILPLARQAVQSNRVAYETSSANFLELITAQRVLQDIESAHVNHLADYQVAVAELNAIVGIEDWLPSQNFTERRKSK